MGKFRWAYIGCGSIAEKTARDITKGNHCIISVYSRNYEKAAAFAEKYNACAFKTAEEDKGFINVLKIVILACKIS